MSLSLRGLGIANPTHSMSLKEATELAQDACCETEKQRRALRAIYRRSGVRNRYTCVPHQTARRWIKSGADGRTSEPNSGPTMAVRMDYYEKHAAQLAIEACREALGDSGADTRDITHLVTVTCTGFYAPGVDIALLQKLPLRSTTERVQVGFMGCHGTVNGLRVALGLAANPAHRILLCAVELCSLHYLFRWDPLRLVGNALFADGSAAVVCGGLGDAEDIGQIVATGSCLFPDSLEDLTWHIRDHGFEMALTSRVPELIGEQLRPWLENWLENQGQSISSIQSWAVHPGGPRILSAVETALQLPQTALAVSREVLAEYGNMSSPTILFILDRLRQKGNHLPCLALAFGPGLVAEVMLIT